jgi:hypothetical protein
MKTQLAENAVKAMKAALKQFGTYTYDDKGPQEVMDIYEQANVFKAAGVEEAAAAFHDLVDSKKDAGRRAVLASAILGELQDWDELWNADGDFLSTFL